MRKFILLIFLFIPFFLFSQNQLIDIEKIIFEGIRISNLDASIDKSDLSSNFNLVYSPFLPTGAVYSLIDINTNKEAIVEIGYAQVDHSPYSIYLQDNLYNYFINLKDNAISKINLKLKFLAWNKDIFGSYFLNLHNYIILPDNSINEIIKNGKKQFYVQIGAYNFYQNSYHIIVELLPRLKTTPLFFMVKKELFLKNETKEIYRVLAGPYSLEEARITAKEINSFKNIAAFIHSSESLLNNDAGISGVK